MREKGGQHSVEMIMAQGEDERRTEPLGSEPVDFTVNRRAYGTE